MGHIQDQMDPKQFGGRKKVSTCHYLIELISMILYNWDINPSHAVLATYLDFSKAFNRIKHGQILTRLAEMSVPNWLLKILMGFLKNRKLVVKYKGAYSEMKDMPGGGPAGTILGMVLFIILVNPVKFSENFTWGQKITQKMCRRTPITSLHLKYFDDLSLLEATNLKEDLKNDQRPKQHPIMYHQRTGHRQDDKKLLTLKYKAQPQDVLFFLFIFSF